MRKFLKMSYVMQELLRKVPYKFFREPMIKASLHCCGKNVHIAEKCDFKGNGNISIGDGSTIGRGSILWATRAPLVIGSKVFTGPNISIFTGNHRMNLIGKYMADVTDDEKTQLDDEVVHIEDDVWIGANAVVLKGVTIAEGCVISAGAVVSRSTEPYGVYAGVPARRIKDRFSPDELSLHLHKIVSRVQV